MFNEARLGKAVDTERCLPIVDEVAGSVARNPAAFMSLARLKNKDDYTYMHSVAVCALMVGLARQLGLNEEQTREAGLAGLLHDIGKMAMPLEILNKAGSLTDAEFDVIRSHPERGYEMLKGSEGVTEGALDVALHHHEKMDGTGYPHALAGDKLSLLARMGAVCDVYDAITSSRPYKAAWDPAGSIQRMAQWQGHFDSNVFSAFALRRHLPGGHPGAPAVRPPGGGAGPEPGGAGVAPCEGVLLDQVEHADPDHHDRPRRPGRDGQDRWPRAARELRLQAPGRPLEAGPARALRQPPTRPSEPLLRGSFKHRHRRVRQTLCACAP
jgi:putative nucleotidyltransferase with HDIG domain